MTSSAVRVAVLARKAELGRGKTRLAETVGAERALAIYRYLIGRTAAAVAASGLTATVYFDPEIGDEEVWPEAVFAKAVQLPSSNLGDRIYDAAVRSYDAERGDAGVLLLGTDCPTLTGQVLTKAAQQLLTHDAVLGPSDDGGYYLLGLRRPTPGVFERIDWSTEAVADQTRERCRELGLSHAELDVRSDIDTEADWRAYVAQSREPDLP